MPEIRSLKGQKMRSLWLNHVFDIDCLVLAELVFCGSKWKFLGALMAWIRSQTKIKEGLKLLLNHVLLNTQLPVMVVWAVVIGEWRRRCILSCMSLYGVWCGRNLGKERQLSIGFVGIELKLQAAVELELRTNDWNPVWTKKLVQLVLLARENDCASGV